MLVQVGAAPGGYVVFQNGVLVGPIYPTRGAAIAAAIYLREQTDPLRIF